MNIRPNRALAVIGAAAVLALAGCGGSSDDPANEKPASSSSSSPTPAQADGSTSASSLADVLAKSMKDGKSAHVTLDMGSQGSGEGDVSFDGDAPAMQMKMQVAGQKTEMRLVDGTVYVGMPGQDGKFVKMAAGQAGTALGIDPTQALEQLEKSGGTAKDLGEGHWQISKDGVKTDLFVGEDGYLEKIEVEGAGSQTITMTYSNWGKDVSVEAPAASDIVKMPGA